MVAVTFQARPLALALLLMVSGLAALAPPAEAASTSTVATLGLSDANGAPGLVGHSSIYYGGATYIFGGRYSDQTYSDKVYRFDHATGQTAPVATLPAVLPSNSGGRYSGAAMLLGTKIYYMGGAVLVMVDINGDGQPDPVPQSSPDVFEFDPATNALRQFPEKLPHSVWGMTAVAASDTKGYLFGGFTFAVNPSQVIDAARRDWVVEFDLTRSGPTEDYFRELATTLPFPVQDAAGARIGGTIYLFGGLGNHEPATNPCSTYVDDEGNEQSYTLCLSRAIIPFTTSNNLVRPDQIREMPYRAQFIGAAVVNGRAYVPGGLLPDGSAASGILEFDPAARTAVRVLTPTLPRALFGAGIVTDGKAVFVVGGRLGSVNQLVDEVVRVDVAPTLPWAPRSVAAVGVQGGLRISWEPPAYDGDSPVSLYRVYRASADEPSKLLKETATLALDDMTALPGVVYTYRIGALNAVGESNTTARVTVTAGTTPPGVVSEFQAYAGDGEAVLRWGAPSVLGGANLSGYRVTRDGAVVATLPPGRTEHRETGLTNGVAYAYAVRAFNVKGDGPESTTLRVSPAAVPPTPGGLIALAQESSVSLTWEPPAGAWERFHVYRSLVAGALGERVGANLTSPAFTDSAVQKGRTYQYQVVSANAAGESPPSEPASASLVRTPGAPTQVNILSLDGEMRVTWQPPTDTGDAPLEALRYYVTRSAPGSPSRIVASDLKVLVHVDRTLQAGTAYTYTITALNPQPSAPSQAVTAVAKEAINQPPVAAVNILPPFAEKDQAVEIDASQSQDPDGAIRTYHFEFGDGSDPTSGLDATVSHVYDRNGTYTVKVIVTDDHNQDAFVTANIVVGEIEGNGQPGSELPGSAPRNPTSTGQPSQRPGSGTGDIPGPGALLVLVAVGAVAFALRRRA